MQGLFVPALALYDFSDCVRCHAEYVGNPIRAFPFAPPHAPMNFSKTDNFLISDSTICGPPFAGLVAHISLSQKTGDFRTHLRGAWPLDALHGLSQQIHVTGA